MPEAVGIGGVVAALSVTSDLTRGHPPGEAMRACLVATELARRAGLDDHDRAVVYYATLLRYAGCAATSHDLAAALGGATSSSARTGDLIDPSRPAEAMRFLASVGRGPGRLRILVRAPGMARFYGEQMRADREVGAEITRRLRLPDAVREAVLDGFERFDGHGAPVGKPGPESAEAARFAAVGFTAAMFDAVAGGDLAVDTVGRLSGRALDPAIGAIFLDARAELLTLSRAEDGWAAVVEAAARPDVPRRRGPRRRARRLRRRRRPQDPVAARGLVAGATKRQIAANLVISPSTVHTHTVHIYGKCGVSARAGLAMFAKRHGLVGAPKID